jgi:hypothetical protein
MVDFSWPHPSSFHPFAFCSFLIFLIFLTMSVRRQTGILPPRSVTEVSKVLEGSGFSSFMSTLAGLDYKLQTRTVLNDGGTSTEEKSWGVTAAEEEDVPKILKTTMMEACLCVPLIHRLATSHRDDRFFLSFFINRMCDADAAKQERLVSKAQHGWHTDAASGATSFLTVVYTAYNSQSDSDAFTALELGGTVGMSNLDDGRFRRASKSQPETPQSWSTMSYYPKTNSFYIFPGYFVSHAVFKVKPGAVRYSIVMFVRLRRRFSGQTVDYYLRSQWALSGDSRKTVCCDICWSTFVGQSSLAKHRLCGRQKCVERALLPY